MYTASDHCFAVCAYGESPYLRECLASLMEQTISSDIFIATSTPNDLIAQAARDFGVPLYVSGKKPGICNDWNHALSRATTPLVTIAHQDDTYAPRYVETMLASISSASNPLIFFSNYGELRNGIEVDDNRLLRIKRTLLKPLSKRGGISGDERIKRRILSCGSSICCPSITYHLPSLPNPPFVSTMKSNLDWEAWERFSRFEGEFVYSPEILMHHRIHAGSETSALIKDNTRTAEDLAMLEKFWPAPIARLINLVYANGQKSNG